MPVSNFDRAVMRMRASGHRPFSPDSATGRAPRVLRGDSITPEAAASAGRIDALIAAFAIGLLLGLTIERMV